MYEMNITTVSKKSITFEFYIEKPMQKSKFKLKLIMFAQHHLINSLDRFMHPLTKTYSYIPFPNLNHFLSGKKFALLQLKYSFLDIVITFSSPLTASSCYKVSGQSSFLEPFLELFIS